MAKTETAPFGLGMQDQLQQPKDVLKKGEKTVTMIFPRRVVLHTDEGPRVEFHPGVQEVPEHLSEHDWLKRNGVLSYDSPTAKKAIDSAAEVSDAEKEVAEAMAKLNAAKAKAAMATKGKPAKQESRTAKTVGRIELSGVPGDNPDTDDDDDGDLSTMTRAQLMEVAAKYDLNVPSSAGKAAIIELINEAKA